MTRASAKPCSSVFRPMRPRIRSSSIPCIEFTSTRYKANSVAEEFASFFRPRRLSLRSAAWDFWWQLLLAKSRTRLPLTRRLGHMRPCPVIRHLPARRTRDPVNPEVQTSICLSSKAQAMRRSSAAAEASAWTHIHSGAARAAAVGAKSSLSPSAVPPGAVAIPAKVPLVVPAAVAVPAEQRRLVRALRLE